MKRSIPAVIPALVAIAVMIVPSLGAQTKAQKDSMFAHASAVNILRLFEFRYNTLVRGPGARNLPPRMPIYGTCEFAIGDYCYGPKNGGLALGGIGTTAESRALTPANYAKQFQKRSSAYINLYVSDLSRLRKSIPGDRWLNGEIVRVEVERGNVIRAMESLDKCKAEPWWCGALKAYTIHVAGMWRRADSAWTKVLALMPERERCAWLDPTWLVRDKVFVEIYRSARCDTRLRMAERAWWLADPLFSIEGNERRSEHLARVVELILIQGHRQHRMMTPAMASREKAAPIEQPMAVSPSSSTADIDPGAVDEDGMVSAGRLMFRFGYPEVVMRLGAPQWTAREEGTISTIAMYPTERLAFVPQGSALVDPIHSGADGWDLHAKDAFEFMSSWPHAMRDIEFQVAHFRRGDSSEVIAAVDVSRDSLLAYQDFMASVTLHKDFDQPVAKTERVGVNQVRLNVRTSRDSALFGVELLSRSGMSGRARFGSGPQPMPNQRVTLSDVLLMEPGEPLPSGLTEASWRALGSTRINTGSTIGIYWETYGLQKDEKPNVSIVVVPAARGLLGRIARAITLQRAQDSLSVQMEATPVAGNEIEFRSVNLDLKSLEKGDYTLSVVVEVDGQLRVVSRRPIEIKEPERMRFP